MSYVNRYKSKRLSNILAALFFALLFFLNITIMFPGQQKSSNSDLSLFGLHLNLFADAYALPKQPGADCCVHSANYICSTNHKDWVDYKPCP